MALRSNGNTHHSTGVQHFGAAAVQSAYPSVLRQNFGQTNRIRNLTAGEGITSELVGLPSGYRHPAAWSMPQKAGLLSARNTISGAGTSSASGQSGYNVGAGISGDGGITDAPLGLIISIAASLLASGGISDAQTEALASMVAALTGSGDVSAVAAGLATMGAMLSGSGAVVAGNTALMDIASTIRGYGDLTPEGIRDTVWNAILANYPNAGSAGNALDTAAVGGIDYAALADAVWAKNTAVNVGEYIVSLSGLSGVSALDHLLGIQTGGTGGGLSVEQIGRLSDVWQRFGLDPSAPLTETETAASFADIVLAKSGTDAITSTRSGTSASGNPDLMIRDIWRRLGLDADTPMTAAADSITAGWLEQTITPTAGGVIVTRIDPPYTAPPAMSTRAIWRTRNEPCLSRRQGRTA